MTFLKLFFFFTYKIGDLLCGFSGAGDGTQNLYVLSVFKAPPTLHPQVSYSPSSKSRLGMDINKSFCLANSYQPKYSNISCGLTLKEGIYQ